MGKRITYDPIGLSKKLNISLEEAEEIVKDRKRKTAGTLENFIKRHGKELGFIKYKEFCEKSANTYEKFQKKYGEDADKKWEEYLKTKESRSEEYFQKKYGDDWKEHRDKFINNWAYKMSKEGFIEKYGEELGTKKFNDMNAKKANTLESFIEKYGEDGNIKFIEYCLSKDSSSMNYFIKKYGKELAEEKYNEKNMRTSPIFNELKKKYGKELAEEKYKKYKKSGEDEEVKIIKSKIHSKFFKNKKYSNPVSKSSNIFFDILKEYISEEMCYGSKKNELRLFDEINGRNYLYDCFIPSLNIIIEYNGSAFHFHETFSDNWVSPYGVSKEESIRIDLAKMDFAKKLGYNIIIIWDFEVNTKNKLYTRINEIKEFINDHRKEMV